MFYRERLKRCKLMTLEERRWRYDLIEMFKIRIGEEFGAVAAKMRILIRAEIEEILKRNWFLESWGWLQRACYEMNYCPFTHRITDTLNLSLLLQMITYSLDPPISLAHRKSKMPWRSTPSPSGTRPLSRLSQWPRTGPPWTPRTSGSRSMPALTSTTSKVLF